MVKVTELRKSYGKHVAVDSISFEVRQGSFFGLLGPNGAGKTTTISMLVGALDADSGSVTVEAKPMGTKSREAKQAVGFVPQELAIFDELSAADNLKFFGSLYGIKGQALGQAIKHALEVTGLADRASDSAGTYSGGMKRRLNIAAALLHSPKLLVLDEPTVGVDPQSRNAIFDSLETLNRAGMTILYTTHYMEEVERLCDTVAVMDHGKIVALDSLTNLKSRAFRSKLVLQLQSPPPPSLLTAIEAAFRTVSSEGMTLTFDTENLDQDLETGLRLVRENHSTLVGVQCTSPTLEDVFLHLTGRELRD